MVCVCNDRFKGATTGFIDSLPVLAALFTGVFVERWNKKSTMIVSDAVRAAAASAIFLVAVSSSFRYAWTLPLLYSLMFILGIMGTFYSPPSLAMLPMIIRDDQLSQAMGYSQSAGAFSQLIGTFGGGALLALVGAPLLFLMNGISFLVSVLTLGMIRMPQKVQSSTPNMEQGRFWKEWKEGLSVLYRNKELLRTQVLILAVNFVLGPIDIVTVAWVKGPMHGTATDLGLVNGCFAAGVLISGFFIKFLPAHIHCRWHVFGGHLIMGLFVLSMGLYPNPWYAMVVAFVASFALGIMNATVNEIFIEAIPAAYRARIGGVSDALDRLAIPAGLACFGLIITFLPLAWVYGIIGAFVVLTGLAFLPTINSGENEPLSASSSDTEGL